METTTKKITLASGKVVTLKTYITGRQVQSLTDGISEDLPKSKFNQEVSNKSIELLVVAVDEKKENILDFVLDLPFDDYKEILEAVNAIVDPKKNATNTQKI